MISTHRTLSPITVNTRVGVCRLACALAWDHTVRAASDHRRRDGRNHGHKNSKYEFLPIIPQELLKAQIFSSPIMLSNEMEFDGLTSIWIVSRAILLADNVIFRIF